MNQKYISLLSAGFLAETGCYAIHGFSEETGDYAILGIAGIRYITYRQALHVPSLSSVPALSSPPLLPLLLFKYRTPQPSYATLTRL